ncbi:MAG: apolipoprotein N-acyltransferase [Nitriliruptorales bacterium]|nr:apolipoprotein N-acyltransferase [Nitriliruptorales bacterium]
MTVRRLVLAVAGGALLFASHPPLDQPWAGYIALIPLLLLARSCGVGGQPVRSGFGWGLVAGLVFFLPLVVWLNRFGAAAWLLLALLQSVFVGGFVAVVAAWRERTWRPLVAVAAWVGFEWLRSNVPLGGFPWGVLAYTQHGGGPVLPVARVAGALGVSAVLAAVAACLEALAVHLRRGERGRALLGPLGGAVGVVGVLLLVPPPPAPTSEVVDVAAVQGNDVDLPAFADRTDSDRIADIADRMVAVTSRLADDPSGAPQVVVWPENSLDVDPRGAPRIAAKIEQAQAFVGDAVLLAGTLLDGSQLRTFRNTIVRFGPGAEIVDVYDKRILVPFGEYVPWRSVFGGLPPLRAIPNDGVPGDRAHAFDIDGVATVGPVTCYESLFPGLVRDQVTAGAQVLVVSTNNASFGRSPASRQHLTFSQLRAVETGRWVMHAGISGISTVVDPRGGLSQRTELFEQAIVRADLPLVDAPTLYVRTGDVVGPVAAAATLAFVVGLAVAGLRSRRGSARAAS